MTFDRRLLATLFTLVAGCQLLVGVDPDDITQGRGGRSGSSATASSGGGGAGGAIPCISAEGCPGVDTECGVRTCVAGLCAHDYVAAGTPLAAQVPGDCKTRVCDGAGSPKLVDADEDILDDGIACTEDTCVAGAPRNTPVSAGVACGDGRVCDASGRCVACLMAAQCGGGLCVDNTCVLATCVNQFLDGTETAPDCGGPSCVPCADGKACLVGRDCASQVCGGAPRSCLGPTCDDGVKNGDETDVDCGGSCEALCGVGEGCHVDGDCYGGACSGSICLASCKDGLQNGGETGVDCGGAGCLPCPLGGGCAFDADCAEGVCRGSVCVPLTCTDGVEGAQETDVDCGRSCAPCGPGKACVTSSDCASRVCAGGVCAPPSCHDHTRNADETGADCGGPSCGKCPDGEGCAGGGDCESGICIASACKAKGCDDGVKDLDETDVDCGGPLCGGCGGGKACVTSSDCASGLCLAFVCTTATCSDHAKNGGETDEDCGGPCPECALGKGCKGPADCQTTACSGGVCVPPTCHDGVKNGGESSIDCGGPTCSKCPGGEGCVIPADCASDLCAASICVATCDDEVQDGLETGVDCGGGTCPGCPAGGVCNVDGDCASHICVMGVCTMATCSDDVTNGGESDVDCGGPCGQCVNGKKCNKGSDCQSGGCAEKICQPVLLISQVRSNGAGGYGDDFVELYNPGNTPITMDPSWKLMHQSAQGGCQGSIERFQGGNQVIPAHGHLLIGGLDYKGPPMKDVTFKNVGIGMSLADAGSLWVTHGGKTVDAFCYQYDIGTLGTLSGGCNEDYTCEGTPVSNLPHDGSSSASSAVDMSVERLPGGALGNGQDTGDTATDFVKRIPATPRNLASPPAP